MDQTQRRKDQFYRVRAKSEGLEQEVAKWRAVVDVAEGELKSAAAEILALKADIERMKAEYQAERNEIVALGNRICWYVERCGLYGPADHLRGAAATFKRKTEDLS